MRHRHPLGIGLLLLLAIATTGCVDVVRAAALPCLVLAVGAPADRAVLVGQVRAPANVLTPRAPKGPRKGPEGPEPLRVPSPDGAPLEEAPVAGAKVYLADGLGTPLPGLQTATTDSGGRYRLEGVPNGHTYVVVADFAVPNDRQATLKALAQADAGTVTADVTLATSLVAVDLSEVLHGFSADLNAERYRSAVDQTHRLLTNDRVPDLTDEPDVMALSAILLNVSPDLRQAVSRLKQDLATSSAPPLVE